MRRPTSLLIGLLPYAITYYRHDHAEPWGECDGQAQRIRLPPIKKTTRERMAQVAAHEVLHAITDHAGLQEEAAEERFVEAISTGLALLARDNPEAVAWWLEQATGKPWSCG